MVIYVPTRRPKKRAVKISLAAVAIFIAKEFIFELWLTLYFQESKNTPLKNCYMLYCKATGLPPYFGSLNECKNAQRHFEEKLRAEFDKLPKYRQREIINDLNN